MEFEHTLLNPHSRNLTVNEPLMEVVVHSSKVTQAAAEIFKEHFRALVNCTEEMKDKVFYCEAAYSASAIAGTVLAATGGFLFNSHPLTLTLSLIGGGISGVLITGGISAFLDDSLSEKIEKNQHILTMCDAIYEFTRSLKSFKENPLEDNVHALFTDFDKLISLFSEKNQEQEDFSQEDLIQKDLSQKYDFWIFSSVTKLFLMEEVMTSLREELQEDWSLFFERFKIESPDDEAIADFVIRKKAVLKPFKIKTQMVTIFKKILQDHIDR